MERRGWRRRVYICRYGVPVPVAAWGEKNDVEATSSIARVINATPLEAVDRIYSVYIVCI
jgi:hypothetical protein